MPRLVYLVVFLFMVAPVNAASNVQISGVLKQGYCSKYFGYVEFEIKNKADQWLEVNTVRLSFGSKEVDSKVKVVLGRELDAWYKATSYKIQKNRQTAALIFGGLAIAGANSDSNAARGAVKFGVTGLSVLALSDKNNLASAVPDSHILATPILVPPGMSVSRWMVIYTNKDKSIPFIDGVDMEISTDKFGTHKQNVYFRGGNNNCVWQKDKNPSGF